MSWQRPFHQLLTRGFKGSFSRQKMYKFCILSMPTDTRTPSPQNTVVLLRTKILDNIKESRAINEHA
jgi:hypothetical protein